MTGRLFLWSIIKKYDEIRRINMKYMELVRRGQAELFKAGIPNADFDAWVLVEKVCKVSKTEYFVRMHEEVEEDKVKEFFAAIEKRKTHYPLQYIIGEWEFMGLPFKVNHDVLIPRSDTEILAEKAVNVITTVYEKSKETIKVLDLCCGTGCIGISVAKMCANTEVVCADISDKAVSVCKQNILINKATNVRAIISDLFENVQGRFHIITCNPPYIKTDDLKTLMPEVRDYEPKLALDGDKDGLKFYRKIIDVCKQYLVYDGYIMFEIGYDQAEAVKQMLLEHGYSDIEVLKDLPGNDRTVVGIRRKSYV